MKRPGKQTIESRGVCGSALKPRTVWEDDRREAKVRTGLGKAHRPGSQGGACGNVDQGGTRHPPRLSKERVLETLRLQLRAPQIYPDRQQRGRKIAHYTLTEDKTILQASGRCLAGNS